MGSSKDDKDDDQRGRAEKSSVFSHSFSTTWRKALVSLPRIVPSTITSHYIGAEIKPFVVKLPSSPPNRHSIPVHVFLQLPSTGDTAPASAPASRARSANNSPRRSGSNTPVSARPRSIHGASILGPSSAVSLGSIEQDSLSPASASTSSANLAAMAARRSFENNVSPSPNTRPGPKPNQLQHRRPTLLLPVIIDFHGGSFILGSPSEQASFCGYMCRSLAATHFGTGVVVISVDYRLGPYAKFPAANEDADDVFKAVLDSEGPAGRMLREDIRQHVETMGWVDAEGRKEWIDLDTSRIAVSGFSSGGNLALNCVIDSPNDPNKGGEDWPSVIPSDHRWPVPILLFYPSFDARLLPDERPRPEGLDPPTGFFARWKIEGQLMPKYLPVERRADVRASPGLRDVKEGLHPKAKILLVLPELDSLSDQSWKWVDKMSEEGRGSDLEVEHYQGEMHGWTQFPDAWIKSEQSKKNKYDSFERAAEFVGRWWYGPQQRIEGTTFGEIGDKKR
jgi:acetyl esterase/lipase